MKNIYIAILVFLSLLQPSFAADPAVFVESYNDAVSLSKTSNKRLLAIFVSDNCVYCSTLKNKIASGDLDSLLEDKIICYVNTVDNAELTSSMNVKMIPDSIIIYDDKIESRNKGYSRLEYKRWLKNNQ